MPTQKRQYFLDNLRAFVVILVIILHGSMTYMAYAPAWWYVVDPQTSLFFTMLVLLIDVPIMQIMFFIAGYFAMPSLKRHGVTGFLKNKTIHIGIPWVVGVLILTPPVAFLTYYSRHVAMGLVQFWLTDFWTKLYQQSVYWYLGMLFLMFALLALIYSRSRRLQESQPVTTSPSWKKIVGFVAVMTAAFFAINLFFYIDTWMNNLWLIVFQPLRLPLYFGYFALGIYARRNNWLTDEGYLPNLPGWAITCLFSGLIYLSFRLTIGAAAEVTIPAKALIDIAFNIFCLSALMTSLTFFKKQVNGNGKVWSSLASSSYGMYYFHPLILYPLTYLFVPVNLPLWLKAPTVILLGILLSWAFTSQVIKRIPGLKVVF